MITATIRAATVALHLIKRRDGSGISGPFALLGAISDTRSSVLFRRLAAHLGAAQLGQVIGKLKTIDGTAFDHADYDSGWP